MTDLEMLRELSGTKCACIGNKKAGQSFCYACYKALPQPVRHALYRQFDSGYQEAYLDARKHLVQVKRVPA